MSKIIGIDLGTSNYCVAVIEDGKPVVIPSSEGGRTTPSIVSFTSNGNPIVGEPAKRQAVLNHKNTFYSIKRYMGEDFDAIHETTGLIPYKVTKGNNGIPCVESKGRLYTPQEISAILLQKAKADAEAYLGEDVNEVVITVPSNFNDLQRKATKDACEIAGLKVKRIINEPTAAALAYGLDRNIEDMTVAIIHMGGGTFDISILELGNGVFDVSSTHGDTHLGGDDFDNVIIEWLADEFKKENGVDLRKDSIALQRLKEAAEKAKIELSSSTSSEINLPYIASVNGVPMHLAKILTRSQFEQLADCLVNKITAPCQSALKDVSDSSNSEIDEVILIGGSTRIPVIQEKIKQIFGKPLSKNINPEEAVAIGAAIQGGVLAGDVADVLLLDVTPLSLGIETLGGVMTKLIESNTTIPCKKQEVFSTAADNQSSVEIHVLQGEHSMVSDNKTIGRFILDGIIPAPRSVPQIEVTFDIDVNGILKVSAKDKGTGKEQSIRVEAPSQLSDDEIERLKTKAKIDAKVEKLTKGRKNKMYQAYSMTSTIKKHMNDLGDKIPMDEKIKIENNLNSLLETHKKTIAFIESEEQKIN